MAEFCTGIKECGVPLEEKYLTKDKLMENYPDLLPQFKSSTLWAWGSKPALRGDLDFLAYQKGSPSQTIAGGNNWKVAGISNYASAAIKADGTLWTWGENNTGEIGNNTTVETSSPVQTISGGTNWKTVAVGGNKIGSIKTDGTFWLWGGNLCGALGINISPSVLFSVSSPVQTISGGSDWKDVTMGDFYRSDVFAIKNDGTLWLWGSNRGGVLGNNNTNLISSPIQTISGGTDWRKISNDYTVIGTIKNDGTLWLWGSGARGDNILPSSNRSSPVQTVAFGSNWKTVSVGGSGSSAGAIKTDGTLWLWGNPGADVCITDVPVQRTSSPAQIINGGTNWKKVDVYLGGMALKSDGSLWSWGYNRNNSISILSTDSVRRPTRFTDSNAIKDFDLGRFGGFFIKEEGDF